MKNKLIYKLNQEHFDAFTKVVSQIKLDMENKGHANPEQIQNLLIDEIKGIFNIETIKIEEKDGI